MPNEQTSKKKKAKGSLEDGTASPKHSWEILRTVGTYEEVTLDRAEPIHYVIATNLPEAFTAIADFLIIPPMRPIQCAGNDAEIFNL